MTTPEPAEAPDGADRADPTFEMRPVHKRCWCYRYGRCLTDCPTADLPFPRSADGRIAGDAEWRAAYLAVIGR